VMSRAITLVLKYPSIAANVGEIDGFGAIDQPGAALLRAVLEAAREAPAQTTAHLIERFRDHPDGRYLPQLAGAEVLDDETHAAEIVRAGMERIVAADGRRQAAEAVKSAQKSADKP